MLSADDIKAVWNGVTILTIDNVKKLIKRGGFKTVPLSNLYLASLSIDIIKDGFRPLHLSISNSVGSTDPATAECIAKDILGEGYKTIGSMYYSNCIHFMKIEKDNIINDIISKKNNGENIR